MTCLGPGSRESATQCPSAPAPYSCCFTSSRQSCSTAPGAGHAPTAFSARKVKIVHQLLLTHGKTAFRPRKINCSKLLNTINSCAGLPNAAVVFVFGNLEGLGLLAAWEARLGQGSRQECCYNQTLQTWAQTGEPFMLLHREADRLAVYRRP